MIFGGRGHNSILIARIVFTADLGAWARLRDSQGLLLVVFSGFTPDSTASHWARVSSVQGKHLNQSSTRYLFIIIIWVSYKPTNFQGRPRWSFTYIIFWHVWTYDYNGMTITVVFLGACVLLLLFCFLPVLRTKRGGTFLIDKCTRCPYLGPCYQIRLHNIKTGTIFKPLYTLILLFLFNPGKYWVYNKQKDIVSPPEVLIS